MQVQWVTGRLAFAGHLLYGGWLMASIVVPVSDPAHPSHASWLRILLEVLAAATSIGPAVVAIADPKDAKLAQALGGLAGQTGYPQE